jgi:hypothetical protein
MPRLVREHHDRVRSGLALRVELPVAQSHERQADLGRQPRLPSADLRQPVIPLDVADMLVVAADGDRMTGDLCGQP